MFRAVARRPGPLLAASARHFMLRQPAIDTSGAPYLVVGGEQAPNPESRVLLSPNRDILGVRRVILDRRLTHVEVASWRRLAELQRPNSNDLSSERSTSATLNYRTIRLNFPVTRSMRTITWGRRGWLPTNRKGWSIAKVEYSASQTSTWQAPRSSPPAATPTQRSQSWPLPSNWLTT